MSVIVKNMKMPPSCYFCGLADTSFIRCEAFSPTKLLEDDCEERRPDWCPLVGIPDGARLIDAKQLKKKVLKWMPPDPCGVEEKEFPFETDICVSMIMEIDEAPTVLEAELEE